MRASAGSSTTAEINAAMRAAEEFHEPGRRLMHDPFARTFVRRRTFRALAARPTVAQVGLRVFDWAYAGLHAEIILRNRHYEEALEAARADGVDQLALLGAGYDSLAFRRDLGMVVYEVDHPATQRAKRSAIARGGLKSRTPVRYIECDFMLDDVAQRLTASGFDPARRSLFVWLGVSYYIEAPQVDALLSAVASVSPAGSRLVWDYMDQSVIDGTTPYPGARRAAAGVRRRGEPYVFGLREGELDQLCARTGFAVLQHLRIPDLARRYGPPGGVWCRTDDYMGVVTAERVAGAGAHVHSANERSPS